MNTDFGLELALDVNYLDKRINYYADWSDYPNVTYKTKTIPASVNLDLSVNQKIARKIYLTGKIYNLFDDRKPIRFGNSLFDRDFPNPGRRINGGVRIEI
jgi:outer membrane receptor protein involved in Fe transport